TEIEAEIKTGSKNRNKKQKIYLNLLFWNRVFKGSDAKAFIVEILFPVNPALEFHGYDSFPAEMQSTGFITIILA
ncbi:MAG: hypothetical protein Q4Q27_15665, partial [Methanosarcina mazei]|nr:hypothetical protein [Methanosarcina mazei]